MLVWTVLLVLGSMHIFAYAQAPCSGLQNCSACIRTHSCSWCSEPGIDLNKRCYQMNNINCPAAFIVNPDTSYEKTKSEALSKGRGSGSIIKTETITTSTSNSSLTTSSSSSSSRIVQIFPQRAKLKLRIGQAYRIKFAYAQAEDYPIDLYYLMDLSKSMEDDKDKLSSLGTLLVESMRKITSNFRLGFGSFVDKVVMPYVSTVPKNLKEPCSRCVAPYGFRNVMPLSTDAELFAGKVKNANVSGNLDAPEGGFDAIMQAVVCQKEIGWRNKTRHLLVFSTDAGFHYAGDGKLGGIIKPNDGKCHLDLTGNYTHSEIQDYPSISQVNLKVKENFINVIFAVTSEQINVYEQLKDHVEGSSSGQLSNDSSNVVDLVRDQYNKISSSVVIKDNSSSSMQIKYFTKGIQGYETGEYRETNKWDGLRVGSRVDFEAEFLAKKCPQNRNDWKQTIQIYPVGLDESFIVDVELICECPCEREDDKTFMKNSPNCNKAGDYMCGVCKCDDQHFGRKCECSETDGQKEIEGFNTCRPDNTSTVDCSGRGNCVCGVCECKNDANSYGRVTGTYCECDNFACTYNNGLLCSGADHGKCDCGRCICENGWSGEACGCSSTNTTCIAPNSTDICSGNGNCNCGQCACNETEDGRYTGTFCEKSPLPTGKCVEFKDCVQCQMYKKGKLNEEDCATNCTTFVPLPVDYVEEEKEKGEQLCVHFDDDDCRFKFVYLLNGTDVIIRAQEQLDCPVEVYFLGIVLGVIAAVVLIGLAILLLWKLLTTIHDRREFAKFEKERMLAKWDTGENPIYKQATSTFKNPTYAGK